MMGLVLLTLLTLGLTDTALGQVDGESIFEQKCAGCHTIGAGNRVGPDLKDVTTRRDREWLISYNMRAADMKGFGDPIAVELAQNWGAAMPNIDITEAESAAIVDFLAGGEQKGPTPAQQTELPDGDSAVGKKLYTGEISFARGGGPCIACHDAAGVGFLGGGTWGKDLTHFYNRYGDQGVTSVLLATPSPFPSMQPVYDKRPLTPGEVAHLKAYFKGIAAEEQTSATRELNILSFGGAGLLLGASHLIWRKRLKKSIRKSLLEKYNKKN
jgi:mono/diheme cytochrome c family protein